MIACAAPARRGQRILVVQIVVQVQVVFPDILQEDGASRTAVIEDIGAHNTIIRQIALARIRRVNAQIVNLGGIEEQVQHGDLAVSEFLGAGVQSTAGAAGGIAAGGAVVLRGKVEVLKAVQCQIEVRNGDLLQCHGFAGFVAGLERIIMREGEVDRDRLQNLLLHTLDGDDQIGRNILDGVNALLAGDGLAVDLHGKVLPAS